MPPRRQEPGGGSIEHVIEHTAFSNDLLHGYRPSDMSPERSELSFNDAPVRRALLEWWEALKENRGDRAELRRCQEIDEVLLTEAYHKLRKRLGARGFIPNSEDQLGAAAGLLSHVDEHLEATGVAAQMAGGTQDEEAPLSGLRFRKLLRIEDREGLYRPLMRAVRLLDRRVNATALAKGVFYWGPSVRKKWARGYYDRALEEV